LKSPHSLSPSPRAKENKRKFAFTPEQLGRLVNADKTLPELYACGGLAGLEDGLQIDRQSGLSSEETILPEISSKKICVILPKHSCLALALELASIRVLFGH
jgi:hypothetical protein